MFLNITWGYVENHHKTHDEVGRVLTHGTIIDFDNKVYKGMSSHGEDENAWYSLENHKEVRKIHKREKEHMERQVFLPF